MNDYENDNDNDELDDYSSGNSFRARSNTWPLNRPDLTAPSSNVCVDEALPEIDVEEDDLFTTNENWSGYVDHDIMSWDPILNAQNQHQIHLQAPNQQPTIIHHQPQPQLTTNHAPQLNTHPHQASQDHQRQQSIHQHHQQSPQQVAQHPQTQHHHHHQQHLHQHHHHHHQQHAATQSAVTQNHPHQIHQQQSVPQHRSQQPPPPTQTVTTTSTHDSFLNNGNSASRASRTAGVNGPTEMIIGPQNDPSIHQQSGQVHHEHQIHQTLNSSRCVDVDDPSEYHIHQLHHLRLDNSNDPQREHYSPAAASATGTSASTATTPSQLSSICISAEDQSNEYVIGGVSRHHLHHHQQRQQHHQQQQQQEHHSHQQSHLQSLTSASYDFDHHHHHHHHHHQQQQQQSDYNIKLDVIDDDPDSQRHQSQHHLDQLDQHQHHQTQIVHQTDPAHLQHHFAHPQMHQQQSHHQHHHNHYHDLNSSSLDDGNIGSHVLSSSLATSGIGLSADLEDLDGYKPSNLLSDFDEPIQQLHQVAPIDQLQQPQQHELQSNSSETVKSEPQSSSAIKKSTDSTSASKTKLNAPRRNAWGNMSYADLISQAIESTSDKRLTLAQIYDWMVQNVPYFKDKGDSNSSAGWKNSVRHNLSLHSRFKRLQNEGTGKSSWWTINPEANVGKCARRRAASMEASKYEKKRGRAKKRAEAIRQGLVSYPSLTNSSLNGSTDTLGEHQSQAQSLIHFHTPAPTKQPESSLSSSTTSQRQKQQSQEHNLQSLDQFANQQQQQLENTPQLLIQTLQDYNIDQPSQKQQQHLRQLQLADRQEQQQRDCADSNNLQQDTQHNFVSSQVSQQQQLNSHQVDTSQYEENDDNNKLQQQQQPQQQSQYFYQQFELSTAL